MYRNFNLWDFCRTNQKTLLPRVSTLLCHAWMGISSRHAHCAISPSRRLLEKSTQIQVPVPRLRTALSSLSPQRSEFRSNSQPSLPAACQEPGLSIIADSCSAAGPWSPGDIPSLLCYPLTLSHSTSRVSVLRHPPRP